MAIKITNEEYFHKVLKEIEETEDKLRNEHNKDLDLLGELEKELGYLHQYGIGGRKGETVVEIGYDFAKWSFSLLWRTPGKLRTHPDWGETDAVMNGGLIFHYPGDQSFSVELEPRSKPGWRVHT